MRRCKYHPYWDASSGACAPCLRHRLLALAAAQNQQSGAIPLHFPTPAPTSAETAPLPLPLPFPRSVSPYVAPPRRSDAAASTARSPHGGYAFFRTPQVGPAANGAASFGASSAVDGDDRGRRGGKFSIISTLFGHSKSDKARPTWFASIMPRVRRKKAPPQAPATVASPLPASARPSYRGMSPGSDSGQFDGDSINDGGSFAQSPWRPTPSPLRKTPMGSISGFAVCLSPLVRPRGSSAPETAVFSGEIRHVKPTHASRHGGGGAAALRHDRSRKLADGGRFR